MHAIAFPCADFSDSFLAQHHVVFARRRFQRGTGEAEFRFHAREWNPCLPVWHDGQMMLVRWGKGDGLPQTSWTWKESVARKWGTVPRTNVIIPARLGMMADVWFPIFEGAEGLLVKDASGQPVVYLLVQPSTHYFTVMTRSPWMPMLVNQTI
jgi:hypothetical protein